MPETVQRMIPEHDQYELLCTLAASGLLEHDEFVDFQAHMQTCSQCRLDYQDLGDLTRQLPQTQGSFRQKLAAMQAKPLEYSRERFLRRARSEGVALSRAVDRPAASRAWALRPAGVMAFVAALIVAAISLAVYHFRDASGTARITDAAAMQQIAALKRQNSTLASSLSQSNQSLSTREREIQNLRTQLESAAAAAENLRQSAKLARGDAERSSSQAAQLVEESRNQEKLLAEAKDEAARINQLRIGDDAALAQQLARITELTNKLRIASATVDQERQLAAAGKDVKQLMAARQLHVIDVHDTDPNGNSSKAFGRVFLTEGNSITFYAFDLSDDRTANANRSFQVWGVPETGKNSPRRLGFLHLDAKALGRWVLTVDNPELVNQLGSVFVTAEPGSDGKQPTGEKMLYAYLGEANHP